MPKPRILFLGRYDSQGASTRYRALQYLPYLRAAGFDLEIRSLLNNDYLNRRYSGKKLNYADIAAGYLHRIWDWHSPNNADLIWLQYEALPFVPAWLESSLKSRIPYIVDYDDAVFHGYDRHENKAVRFFLGDKIDRTMRDASVVVAGNSYIADRATRAGAKAVEVLPTVIDLDRYSISNRCSEGTLTIGWIGTPVTARYVKSLEPILQELARNIPIRVLAIGASGLRLEGVPYEVIPWSDETEVANIQRFDVGIMPLDDSPWERGKCGFKLIQYMACGLPVVGTPVGVNSEIIKDGINGFPVRSAQDWLQAIQTLYSDPMLRHRMGQAGRTLVEEKYCIQQTAPRLANLFTSAIKID